MGECLFWFGWLLGREGLYTKYWEEGVLDCKLVFSLESGEV